MIAKMRNFVRGRSSFLGAIALWGTLLSGAGFAKSPDKERHLLYVVTPGIRNYLQFGGAGILVFDMDNGHRFLKRIETPASQVAKPENIKGVCASATTQSLYFTTLTKLYCLDLRTDKTLWEKALPGGCDRLSITPGGKSLYVPSLEGDDSHGTWSKSKLSMPMSQLLPNWMRMIPEKVVSTSIWVCMEPPRTVTGE